MTRDEIQKKLLQFFEERFEIQNPSFDDELRDVHGFDSIDAIELLAEIEELLGVELTQEQKKSAMDIRTLNEICDWIERMDAERG